MRNKLGRFVKGHIPWCQLHPECMPRGKDHPMYGVRRFGKDAPNYGNLHGNILSCLKCGKRFYARISKKKKYCSRKCFGKHRSDLIKEGKSLPPPMHKKDDCWNWKGGTSRGYKTGYYSQKYINWRRDIFIRDEFTCRGCGKKHIYITAHHIKSFAKYPELRFDIKNGKTLCEECHANTDNYRGKNVGGIL